MKEISSQVKFNGHMLTDIIKVNVGFTIGLGTARENKLQTVGNSDGQIQLIDSRYDSKTISIPFTLPYQSMGKKRELSAMLNVREPAQLWFSSEPDKYYMALPVSTSLTEEWDMGSGTLEFICIDPFAYAETPKTFNSANDIIIIENKGTMPTPINFQVQSTSDNGFIGLTNGDSIIQVGHPDEIDGHPFNRSERLINENWTSGINSNWDLNKGYLWGTEPGVNQGGTMTTTTVPPSEGGFVYHRTATTGWGANMEWSGPSLHQTIPTDSNGVKGADNWEFYAYGRARAEHVNEVGIQEYNLTDANKNHVAGVRLVKNNTSNKHVTIICYVGEKMIWHAQDKRWDNFTGVCDIKKMGNTITFTIRNLNSGASQTIQWVEAGIKAVDSITYWNGKYQIAGKATAVMPMYNMVMQFTKMQVNKWSDDPNTFKDGDIIDIKSSGNTLKTYKNNLLSLDLNDLASKPMMAPVGLSRVQFITSTFAKIPKVIATIREKYI